MVAKMDRWLPCLCGAFVLLLLLPYLSTGYYYDDALNVSIRGYVHFQGGNIHSFVLDSIRHWIKDEGRFFPLFSILFYFWYWLPNLAAYRWAQIGLTAVDVALFVGLLRELGVGRNRSLLVACIAPALFQLRAYHDPIASYSLLLQLSFFLGTLSTLLFVRFLKRGGWAALAVSSVSYCALLSLYETGLVFAPILFAAIWFLPSDPVRKKTSFVVFAACSAAYMSVSLWARHHAASTYHGISAAPSLGSIWPFLCQASASFPLIYAFLGKAGIFKLRDLIGPDFVSVRTIFVFAAASAVFYVVLLRTLQEEQKATARESRLLQTMAWSLILVPSALLAISSRYQVEIRRPGMGYLPVFLSYFGMAVLLAGYVLKKAKQKTVLRVSLILGAVAAFEFTANIVAARKLNQEWMSPRAVTENALRNGLLSDVPNGTTIYYDGAFYGFCPEFVYLHSGKEVRLMLVKKRAEIDLAKVPQDARFLHLEMTDAQNGMVTLASLTRRGDPERAVAYHIDR